MAAGHRRWRAICTLVKAERRPCHLCDGAIDYTLPYRDPITCRINTRRFTGDHIVPTNKGGADTYANCGASHWACNAARHDDDLVSANRRTDNW